MPVFRLIGCCEGGKAIVAKDKKVLSVTSISDTIASCVTKMEQRIGLPGEYSRMFTFSDKSVATKWKGSGEPIRVCTELKLDSCFESQGLNDNGSFIFILISGQKPSWLLLPGENPPSSAPKRKQSATPSKTLPPTVTKKAPEPEKKVSEKTPEWVPKAKQIEQKSDSQTVVNVTTAARTDALAETVAEPPPPPSPSPVSTEPTKEVLDAIRGQLREEFTAELQSMKEQLFSMNAALQERAAKELELREQNLKQNEKIFELEAQYTNYKSQSVIEVETLKEECAKGRILLRSKDRQIDEMSKTITLLTQKVDDLVEQQRPVTEKATAEECAVVLAALEPSQQSGRSNIMFEESEAWSSIKAFSTPIRWKPRPVTTEEVMRWNCRVTSPIPYHTAYGRTHMP